MPRLETVFSCLLGAALAACAPTSKRPAQPVAAAGPAVDYVNAGIYEAADPSDTRLRISLFLSPNHGFILRKTHGGDPLVEYRGEWDDRESGKTKGPKPKNAAAKARKGRNGKDTPSAAPAAAKAKTAIVPES